MAKREKTLNEMGLEEVRMKLGYAIGYINMYAADRQTLDTVLTQEDFSQKFFDAVKEAREANGELAKRFGAPANYEQQKDAA